MYKIDFKTGLNMPIKTDGKLINTTIAWYQGANDLFSTGAYKTIKNKRFL